MTKILVIILFFQIAFLSNCAYEAPHDLQFDSVHLADVNSIPIHPAGIQGGKARGLVLVFILHSKFSYPPYSSFVLDGFCGSPLAVGNFGNGDIYDARMLVSDDVESIPEKSASGYINYFIFAEIAKSARPTVGLPSFDLASDHRDVCLRTETPLGLGLYARLISNTVVIPNKVIKQAIKRGGQRFPLPATMLELDHD